MNCSFFFFFMAEKEEYFLIAVHLFLSFLEPALTVPHCPCVAQMTKAKPY